MSSTTTDETTTKLAVTNIVDSMTNEMSLSSLNDKVLTIQDSTQEEPNDNTIALKLWQSRMPQKFITIWLDPNIDESDAKYHDSIIRLRNIVNTVQVFTEVNRCVDFITNIEDGRFFLILSNNVDTTVVSLIDDLPQVGSIYILYDEESKAKQNLSEWKKVKGIYDDVSEILHQLQKSLQRDEENLISTNIFSLGFGLELDELNQSFMYSVLLKEILIEMNYDEKAKTDFFELYREQYSGYQIDRINEMEKSYNAHSPIWWYIEKPFIYSTLNKALRTQDISSIIKMGFYLKDLHQQIEQVYSTTNQAEKKTVYRGQNISKEEFEKIRNSIGGLLSFNSFLSTTTDRNIAWTFANNARDDPHLTGILFDMEVDPTITKTSFASMRNISDCSGIDDEILFSMHTVFRIGHIMEIDNRIWNVQLIMTSDTDTQLELLTNRIREEIQGPNELYRLGNLLMKMGQFDIAEEIYNKLLETSDHGDLNARGCIFNQLGNILNERGHLEKALSFLEKTLETRLKSRSPNPQDLATTYNSIGSVYNKMGQYSEALSFYEKTLELRQQTLSLNHLELASSYDNIGLVYSNMGKYSKALLYYEQTLQIRQTALPSNHPDLAMTYNNIGLVCNNIGEYLKALSYYEKTFEIQQKSLPSDHPSLASTYNNIGSVHQALGDYSTALIYLEKTLEIQQKTLPSNHPNLATTCDNIGAVYHSMGEYSKALSYLEESLQIRQVSLPSNHPDLATTSNNIGLIYTSKGEYEKALSYLEKTLDILKTTLPPNHPSLANTFNNIGSIHQAMGDYSKALSYYEKTLQIRQQSLPTNHPDLAITYKNIGLTHNSMGAHSKALSFFEKTLQIQQTSLPSNHPSLADTYNNIGTSHSAMNDYLNAISYYKKALKIQQISLPSNHPSLATTYNNIGRAHAAREHYAYALHYYQDAQKIQEKVLSSNHPSLAETYNSIGEMHRLTGDCESALFFCRKTLNIQQKVLPTNHPLLATTYSNMGQIYSSMKKYEKAVSYMEKTFEIQSESLPVNHPSLADSHYHMAKIFEGLHRYEDASRHAIQAVDVISHSIEPNQSQAKKYQEYHLELMNISAGVDTHEKKESEQWTYPILLVSSSSQQSPLFCTLKNITNGCLMSPIQTDDCINRLRSDQNIKSVVFEMSSLSVEERDRVLKEISSLESIEAIYLLGKSQETKEQRNRFLDDFDKVCIFCEDKDKLAVQLVLDMASDCRRSANQSTQAGDKDTARKHFQRGIDLYDGLKKFISETPRSLS